VIKYFYLLFISGSEKWDLKNAVRTAKEFVDAWKLAESGETVQEKHRLHFENLEVLLKTLTPGRWALLKKLHANGPVSIRALANDLGEIIKMYIRTCGAWKILD
jgi:predicted transcriptional regulator